jgi:voltage-gated potassium channel
MTKSILVGLLMTVVTVGIHAVGTSWWVQRLVREERHETRRRHPIRTLCATATVLLSLQICEVVVWAITYLLLPTLDEVNTLEEAVYFSTVTFTALGYGDIVLTSSWRLLGAIQAMAGLLIFGWSTAVFFAVCREYWLGGLVSSPPTDSQ